MLGDKLSNREIDGQDIALVIGVNGQDGRILTEMLLERGQRVIGVGKQPSTSIRPNKNFHYLAVDFTNKNSATSILDEFKPKTLFHFAAIHGNKSSMIRLENTSYDLMKEVAVGVTETILSWQRKHLFSRSFFALSSQMYTPINPPLLVNENTQFAPINEYGKQKLEMLKLIREARASEGVKSFGLMLFNHSSKYSKREFLIPRIAKELRQLSMENSSTWTFSESNQMIDIACAEDIMEAILMFVEYSKTNSGEDLILGSGKLLEIGTIILESSVRLSISTDRINLIKSKNELPAIYADLTRAREILNWNPRRSIVETVCEIVGDESI